MSHKLMEVNDESHPLILFSDRAIGFIVCSFLMLVVQANPIECVGAQDTSKLNGKLIRVWTVASPYGDDLPQTNVPLELQRQAENLGYRIEVTAFRAAGFAAKFRQALQENNEPEVLTFNNYGVVWGVSSPTGWVEGIGFALPSLATVREALAQLQPRGWVLLVSSAVNYEAVKTLSMQPPVCDAESDPQASSQISPELRQAQETAVSAAQAYLLCDRSSLSALSDDSRLGRKCFLPDGDTVVDAVKPCSLSGNRNLAFVSLVSTFAAEARSPRDVHGPVPGMDLGHQSLLAILRNHGGVWRLLAITDDPVDTVHLTPLTTQRIGSLLDDVRSIGIPPAPARLFTANSVYPQPGPGQRFGDFVWQPNQSTDVIGQVVEFMWGPNRGSTRLFFLSERAGKLSSGYLWSGGLTNWRVWTVSKGGEVAFSEQHSFVH
jgi:hypothetical protein